MRLGTSLGMTGTTTTIMTTVMMMMVGTTRTVIRISTRTFTGAHSITMGTPGHPWSMVPMVTCRRLDTISQDDAEQTTCQAACCEQQRMSVGGKGGCSKSLTADKCRGARHA